jgi:hypothetical protein
LVPSERVIVPRSLALALPDTVTLPFAGTAGHAEAQAPEQADMFMLSFVHRYTARPVPSVRNAPAEPVRVVITAAVAEAPAEPDAAGEPAAAAGLDAAAEPDAAGCDPPLLQAAAISAAATGTPSFTGTGIRASNELIILIMSFPKR